MKLPVFFRDAEYSVDWDSLEDTLRAMETEFAEAQDDAPCGTRNERYVLEARDSRFENEAEFLKAVFRALRAKEEGAADEG